jgi:NAD+ diphosphatase
MTRELRGDFATACVVRLVFCKLPHQMDEQNIFAGAFVDRSGHRRDDADWLSAAAAQADSRFLPIWRGKCLVVSEPPELALRSRSEIEAFLANQEPIFLGMYRDVPTFAINIPGADQPGFAAGDEYHDLRYLGSMLSAEEANLAAHGRALVTWHATQRFCGICAAPTRVESGGNTRRCTDAGCGIQVFPRVDPAIIVLVKHENRCLLGRQEHWPEGRYSTIAGFVEPGESLEDAVRREVQEETNIEVGEVRYHSSQPWPFPSSLMLGFIATAMSDDIRLNDGELEDARWFSRKECRSGFPKLPYRISIARRLVDYWLNSP